MTPTPAHPRYALCTPAIRPTNRPHAPAHGKIGAASATSSSSFPSDALHRLHPGADLLQHLHEPLRLGILARSPRFIGLGNYADLLNDSLWWLSLRNTIYFAFLTAAGNAIFRPSRRPERQPASPSAGDYFHRPLLRPGRALRAVMGIILGWMPQHPVRRAQLPADVDRHRRLCPGSPARSAHPHAPASPPSGGPSAFPCSSISPGCRTSPKPTTKPPASTGPMPMQLLRLITLPRCCAIIMFVAITRLISHFKIARPTLHYDRRRAGPRLVHGHHVPLSDRLALLSHGLRLRHRHRPRPRHPSSSPCSNSASSGPAQTKPRRTVRHERNASRPTRAQRRPRSRIRRRCSRPRPGSTPFWRRSPSSSASPSTGCWRSPSRRPTKSAGPALLPGYAHPG